MHFVGPKLWMQNKRIPINAYILLSFEGYAYISNLRKLMEWDKCNWFCSLGFVNFTKLMLLIRV